MQRLQGRTASSQSQPLHRRGLSPSRSRYESDRFASERRGNSHANLRDLNEKVNYYIPALTALTLASPLRQGELWSIRGRVGKSVRTYHRSVAAPAIEIHPDESLRLELKPFEMTHSLVDYRVVREER